MRTKILISSLCILIAIVGFSFIHLTSNAEVDVKGRPLPLVTMDTLTQGEKSLQNIGAETSLLVVYASWCGSCRAEHPLLMDLAKEGVPLYGLAWIDKPAKTKRFLAELGNPFKWTYVDQKAKKTAALDINSTPETFVIKNGHIIYKHAGPLSRQLWDDTLKFMF